MKVAIMTKIDCEGMPIQASVEAEVPSGVEDLDMVLYDAMAQACRLLAKAARDDQKRVSDTVAGA